MLWPTRLVYDFSIDRKFVMQFNLGLVDLFILRSWEFCNPPYW